MPFIILTQEEYITISEKDPETMYLITNNNQLKKVMINNNELICYTHINYQNNNDIIINRQLKGEKIQIPECNSIELLNSTESPFHQEYNIITSWKDETNQTPTIVSDNNITLLPIKKTLFIQDKVEISIISSEEQLTNVYSKIFFDIDNIYAKTQKLFDNEYIPIIYKDELNNNFKITFEITNKSSLLLGVTLSRQIDLKLYTDIDCTKLLCIVPIYINIYSSNEPSGD